MRKGEEILVIAEDDDSYELVDSPAIRVSRCDDLVQPHIKDEKILICGWRRDARDMLQLFNELCAEAVNSSHHVATNYGLPCAALL